jgi:hypothetical protein
MAPGASFTMAPIPIHQAITTRHTKSNYLLWRAQLLPYLRSSKLIGFLDGSNPASKQFISTATTTGEIEEALNPAYDTWYDQDQQLLSGLLSLMTEEVLRDVMATTSSREVWTSLHRKFASSTEARTVQLRVDLATSKKQDLSAADFYRKITGLASKLAAIDAPLRDEEILAYLFAGLPVEYDPFVTAMTTKTEALSLDNVFAHLVSFEDRLLRHQAELQQSFEASANYAGRGGGRGGRDRGHGDHGRGARERGGGAPNRGGGAQHGGYSRNGSPRPQCQICEKFGHTALRCWYRMDESYQEEGPSANVASNSYKVNADWYNDTGGH